MDVDLRLGDWREVLADVGEVSALVTDPPYGARTHGNDRMADLGRRDLTYAAWTHREVEAFVDHWSDHTKGWMACMTSDDLIADYRGSYACNKRLDFAPVPCLSHRPRLQGDGPGSGAVYLVVSRPRSKAYSRWGSLPCWYEYTPDRDGHIGGKSIALMRAIIRDYTRPGDLVCDPCAGYGSTAIACQLEGRRFVGAEVDPETHAKAMARLARMPKGTATQPALFDRLEAAE